MPVTHGQGNPDWTTDETILALELLVRTYPDVPDKHNDTVHELSALLRAAPFHQAASRNETFRNNHGVSLKIQNLLSLHPDKQSRKGLRTTRTERAVWNRFIDHPEELRAAAEAIRRGIDVLADEAADDPPEDFEDGVTEGSVVRRVHRLRERKGASYRPKIIARIRRNRGRVECEACGFAPFVEETPAAIVESAYEVHHLVPLSEVVTVRTTRLRDLALLCATCHRLIHAIARIEGTWLDVAGLTAWLEQNTDGDES